MAKATPGANYQWTDGSVATKSISWSIASAPVSKATVAPVGNQQYTGKDIKPEPVVSFSGKQLVRGTDYTLAYRNNTNVGTATITIMGMGNFSGTSEVSFKIVKETVATQDMYRLYNPNSGEHFYTANADEKNYLASIGWKYEGVGWVAPLEGDDVYRMYNKNGVEHHYTTSAAERDNLVRAGWTYEGVGWKSGGSVRLYRDYNPNAFANNHNYTANKAEHDMLVRVGWKAEGYAWNGVEGGRSG